MSGEQRTRGGGKLTAFYRVINHRRINNRSRDAERERRGSATSRASLLFSSDNTWRYQSFASNTSVIFTARNMVDRKSGERGCRNNKSQRPPRAHPSSPVFPTHARSDDPSRTRLPVPAGFDHVSSLAFGPSLTSILYRTGNYRIRVIHANPSARRATNYYRAIESIRVPPTPPMLFLVSPRVSQPVAVLS